MRKRTWLTVGTALIFAVLGGFQTAHANSNGILNGRYVSSGQGVQWFTPNNSNPLKEDLSFSGIADYDGHGHVHGTFTLTAADALAPTFAAVCTYVYTGTYTLNDDNTGTSTSTVTATSGSVCDPTPSIETANLYSTRGGSQVCSTTTTVTATGPTGVRNSLLWSSCGSKQ